MTARFICTKEDPYTLAKAKAHNTGGFASHPDAKEVDCSCDCCAQYECPHCNAYFKVELPQ
jgi:hypothetical protein